MGLLSNILWAFQKKGYSNIEDFNKEITDYQTRILKEKASWEPHKVVIDAPEINVSYEAWIKGKEDIADNETIIGNENEVFSEDNSDYGMFQVEFCAKLKAANGANFTALDLMYQLHNQVSHKELGDHIFFEGLTADDNEELENNIPHYLMYLGS
ncbi:hypothetical protein SAMN05421594_2983 [Chryseobacterium oleae]|uniref:Uncharacterized protein n=1 Tax=Chryseobacterium oleae TaxID=491207 RepID=A0A1I4ZH26_CHROL|nr:hypothetical protein [Chryseobacterium oleae]SFN49498.1 hypothetical protein SAMN05421594_2983 [Chryseobacterium oleae]